jgi:hypothetical protein
MEVCNLRYAIWEKRGAVPRCVLRKGEGAESTPLQVQ